MRRVLVLTAATATLALAACGSSKSGATAAATTTAPKAAATTAAPPVTTAAAAVTTAAAGSAGTAEVGLKEFAVTAPTLKAGDVTLSLKNSGQFAHELLIIKAASFDAVPKDANGAVDESKLAASDLVAKSDKVAAGTTGTLKVTLAAGTYVFVCNLGTGANSHAAKGQHADVTVG